MFETIMVVLNDYGCCLCLKKLWLLFAFETIMWLCCVPILAIYITLLIYHCCSAIPYVMTLYYFSFY